MTPARVLTAAELAARLSAPLAGDPARIVRGIGTLEQAGPEELSWVGTPELLPRLATSSAGVVLMPLECPVPPGRTAIRVADPDLAMCDVLRWLAPPPDCVPPGVHPSAVIADDAQVAGAHIGPHASIGPAARVGPGTQLHAGVRIGAGVSIGRDCVLWPNAVIRERVTIGDRVIIHANTVIGTDGFGYLPRAGRNVKIPQVGSVIIEDDVEIGSGTCIDRARSGVTRIGRGTKIDNLCQVGHNVEIGEDCILVAQCGISGSTTLGHRVLLAGQVGLIDHLRIGDGVQVTAKSGVSRHVPKGVFSGIPAVERSAYERQQIAVRHLPQMLEALRELTERVERLESTAHD